MTLKGQISLFADSYLTSPPSETSSSHGTSDHGSTSTRHTPRPKGGSSSEGRSARGTGTTGNRRGPKRSRKNQFPCVFSGEYVREEVDPRVKEAYAPKRAPFGDFRRQFKAQYCTRVNPTGYPEDCPYPEEDCANRFMQIALACRDADKPGALFRAMARSKGAEDADNRPLARNRVPEGRMGRVGHERGAHPSRRDVRPVPEDEASPALVLDRKSPPPSIAEVLRSMDPRAREVQSGDGDEGMGS